MQFWKKNWSPFGPNSLSIGRKIRKFSMHMDDPKDPCKIKWYNPILHGWSWFLGHLAICYLVKVFQSPKHGWGKTNKWSFLVSLDFMSFFLTFESLKTKTYVFLLVFPFFFSRRKHSKNSRLLLPPKHLIIQSQKRHCLSGPTGPRDDKTTVGFNSRWKICLSEAFGGKQLEWRHFYRVLWGGGVFGNYMDLSENEKNLYGSIVYVFLVGKCQSHRSLIHSSHISLWFELLCLEGVCGIF